MKTTLSKKAAYVGTGAGLVLFAIFGLLPGGILGGAAGIKFAGIFFSLPLETGLVSRLIVLLSIAMGVAFSAIAIVTASAASGWLAGALLEPAPRISSIQTAEERIDDQTQAGVNRRCSSESLF